MRNQVSEPIELALNKPSPTMWDSVLKAFRRVLDKASEVYLKKAQSKAWCEAYSYAGFSYHLSRLQLYR